MSIEQLKSYSHCHQLQAGQHICHVQFEGGFSWTGIYDDSNGHWMQMADMQEVGYLNVIHLGGEDYKIAHILEYKTNSTS